MSQSFIKKSDNGPHSALAGLGILSAERPTATPADVLRRIVEWRDNVHAGRVVRGAELEALIEEGRVALAASTEDAARLLQWFQAVQDLNPKYLEPEDFALAERLRTPGVEASHPETKPRSDADGGEAK